MNTTNTQLDELLLNLKESGQAIHLREIDITWDFNNQLVNSIEMLSLLLTKTSCLPLVPDFTNPDVTNILKINNDQAKLIQGFNEQLIYSSNLLKKYIIQNYVILSIGKRMLDDMTDQLPEKDITYLLDFIKNYNQFSTQNGVENSDQTGGQKQLYLKYFIYIFILLLFTCASNDISLVDTQKMYSKGIISYTPEQLTNQLVTRDITTSESMDLNNAIVEYDRTLQTQLSTTYGQLVSLFKRQPGGQQLLYQFIEQFNVESGKISKEVESTCLDLMVLCRENGIFRQWIDIDSLQTTKRKINEIDEKINEQSSQSLSDISGKAIGTIVTGVGSTITGDVMTPLSYLTSLGYDTFKLISNTNSLMEQRRKYLSQQKTSLEKIEETSGETISESEFEYKISKLANVYCSLSYNLQLIGDETSIRIEGDYVPYPEMRKFMESLEENLILKIRQLSTNTLTDEIKTTLRALTSLQQRLSVLKGITEATEYTINISSKIYLLKMTRNPTKNSLNEIQTYFNDQLLQLTKMLEDLRKMYPKEEEQLERSRQVTIETARLSMIEQEIKDIAQNATSIERQLIAERKSRDWQDWFYSVQTVSKSWLTAGFGISSILKDFSSSLSGLVGAIPLGILDGLLKIIGGGLYNIITSPTGITIILLILFYYSNIFVRIGNGMYRFTVGTKNLVVSCYSGIIAIWQLIPTPFGQRWRLIGNIFPTGRQPQNQGALVPQNRLYNRDERLAATSLLDLRRGYRGGKKIKTRKIKKVRSRKNKSRKMNKYNKKNKTTKNLKRIK